jgi:hypothetical protein
LTPILRALVAPPHFRHRICCDERALNYPGLFVRSVKYNGVGPSTGMAFN